jgi:DNA-directed RNA polymerase specialized sigma24 family protein
MSVADMPFNEREHSQPDTQGWSDPEMLLRAADDIALIERALRSVPPRCRELLVLGEFDELSYRELADVLGCADRHGDVRIVALVRRCAVRSKTSYRARAARTRASCDRGRGRVVSADRAPRSAAVEWCW